MIRNETEYQETVRRLGEEARRLADHQARLEEMHLGHEEVKRALDPLRSFHLQLQEEVESYERLGAETWGSSRTSTGSDTCSWRSASRSD